MVPSRVRLVFRLACLAALSLAAAAQEPTGLPLKGSEAEAFLLSAKVTARKTISTGITLPQQLTLSDGQRTLKAIFKTVEERRQGVTSFQDGRFEVDFRDSWAYEVAAYELDKLLGLGLVPPTVERRFGSERGALQLWVVGSMTEWERREKKLSPPDTEAWNRQMWVVRLLHQLTYDTDRTNIRNVLVDREFRVYAIDFSRAFRTHDTLIAEAELERFSRPVLEALRPLDRATLKERLGRWLENPQIDGLLKRRDRILALAERRVAEKGEAAVLYP